MKSGMLAAEAVFDELTGSESSVPANLDAYQAALEGSWIYEELHRERNIRPSYVPQTRYLPLTMPSSCSVKSSPRSFVQRERESCK